MQRDKKNTWILVCMHLFVLLHEHLDMAKAEIFELLRPSHFILSDKYVLADIEGTNFKHLGLCQRVLSVVGVCEDFEDLSEVAKSIKGSFSVRCEGNRDLEKEIGGKIYDLLDDAKVDLKNADTKIEIYFIDGKYYFGVLEFVGSGLDSHKSHNRPESHPSSLHPRVARAMVNLLGECSEVFDPFCGSGGILIEAGLTGHEVVGFDIDKIQVARAKINCKHFGVDARIEIKDATLVKEMDYFVCDLPYGLNTKTSDGLFEKFFDGLKFKRAVVGCAGFQDVAHLIEDREVLYEFTLPLHKNLKKKILVIE